jgi:hypothetical protein
VLPFDRMSDTKRTQIERIENLSACRLLRVLYM